ncbi:MAG: hypothetical protein FJX47_07830 [Alphaproteobacteria bacterium]|nr:hypothetical protein [Alphaproteobacteria bacterium]
MNKMLATVLLATTALGAAALAQNQTMKSETGSATLNWEKGYIESTGRATARPDPNPVKMRLQAVEAAKVVAQARLVETINGVHLVGGTLVQDAEFAGQKIMTKIKGMLANPVVTSEDAQFFDAPNVPGGKVVEGVVTVRVCLTSRNEECTKFGGGGQGLYQAMAVAEVAPKPKDPLTQDQAKAQVAAQPARPPAAKAPSGLILSLGGTLDYIPMLAPEVITKDGKTVYSVSQVDAQAVVAYGPMQYVDTVDHAKQIELLGGNPVIVKVINVNAQNQIVVAAEDGARIVAEAGNPSFLSGARVALAYK